MTEAKPYLPINNSSLSYTAKSMQAHSLVKSAVSFVFDKKFESAAGCFEALLILADAEPKKFNFTAEYLITLKFALCCCYFYAGTDHERNLQLLKDIHKYEEHIPAVHYITAAILYKLNVPSLALKNIEFGLHQLSKCSLPKLHFWPETDIVIHLTEKSYLKSQLEELKEKLQSAVSYAPSSPFSENIFKSQDVMFTKNSKLNAAASEFFPGELVQSDSFFKSGRVGPYLKEELDKHHELLQKIRSEQSECKQLKAKMDSQQKMYEEKLNALQDKLDAKDQLIVTLSTKNRLTQETIDHLLGSIKSLIAEQNKTELEKIKTENIKSKGIIAQLIEKYFSIQFAVSKSNETHCITALENLNTLLKNQSSSSFVNASELQEEINVWKIKLDNVQKHRRAAENALMLLKGNISEDALKLLNELSAGCCCVANKPDLLQQICLRNALKNVENNANSHVNTFYDDSSDYGTKTSVEKDWKYHLRRHRGTSLGLSTSNGSDAETGNNDAVEKSTKEMTKAQNKRVSFVAENNTNYHESWMDQEISKLSETVKLIGGPNYWRLIVFIKNKLPMESENSIVDAVEMVRATYGKLNGLSRDTIFLHANNIIRSKKGIKNDSKFDVGKGEDSATCSICLEQFEFNTCGILTCGHRFHKSCIQLWLGKQPLCPVCKAFIVPQEYNT